MVVLCPAGAYGAAARGLRSSQEQAGLTADSAADAIESFQEEVRTLGPRCDLSSAYPRCRLLQLTVASCCAV